MSDLSPRTRAVAVVGGAVLLATVIGFVLLQLGGRLETPEDGVDDRLARDPSAIDLLEPPPLDGPLGPDERSGRGWIQITDENGRLAQQYRCDFLDPSPEGYDPGWLRMTNPQLEVHQDDGSVVVMLGEEAMAYAPSSAIESGTIRGEVTVRVYGDADARRDGDPLAGLELELRTHTAQLDGILGEVTCPGAILAETRDGVFVGSDVQLLLGDGTHSIGNLSIRALQHVRLASNPSPATAEQRRLSREGIRNTPRSRVVTTGAGRGTRSVALASRVQDEAAATDEPQWYRMVLRDSVRIRRGAAGAGLEGTADELHLIFSDSSDTGGFGAAPRRPAGASAATRRPSNLASPVAPGRPSLLHSDPTIALIAAAIAQSAGVDTVDSSVDPRTTDVAGRLVLAPAPSDEDTWITCDGGLLMRPLDDDLDRPRRDDGLRIELRSRGTDPVRLRDHAASIEAIAGRAGYELPDGRVTLDASADGPVRIDGPEFELRVPRLELVRRDGTGRLDGAGTLRVREVASNANGAADDAAESGPRPSAESELDIAWSDDVELAFAKDSNVVAPVNGRTEDDEAIDLSLTDLESARFEGAVRISGRRAAGLAGGDPGAASGDDRGELDADVVDVGFRPGPDGRPELRRLAGTGDVAVRSADRRLWADRFAADLRASTDTPGAPNDAPNDAEATTAGDLSSMTADGDVVLRLAEGRWAWGDSMRYDGETDRATLDGDDVLLLAGPDMLDRAGQVTVIGGGDRAAVEGRGRLRRLAADVAPTEPSPGAAPGRPSRPAVDEDAATELLVTWTDALTVEPDAGTPVDGDSEPGRRITVAGDAAAITESLSLQGADRIIALTSGEAREPGVRSEDLAAGALRRVEATGSLTAIALEDGSSLTCRELAVDLVDGVDGPVPSTLRATDRVVVTGPDRTMRTSVLDVTFAREGAGDSDRNPMRDAEGPAGNLASGDVERLEAGPGVEVRLADGRRIIGDRLVGSGIDASAVITGTLLVATPDSILEDATRVEIERGGDVARVVGPGRFRALRTPVALDDDDRRMTDADALRAAYPDGAEELVATWTDGAVWQAWETASGDAAPDDAVGGRLVLSGSVEAEATPDPRELDRVRARELVLEFGERTGDRAAIGDDPAAASGRELERLVARGDARLESRAWLRDDRADSPRVLSIDADNLDWNQRAGTAVVEGPGRLVVRDLRQPESDAPGQDSETDAITTPAFGPRGTSEFTWTERLRMEPAEAGDTLVRLIGDVGVRHRSLDGAGSTMSGRVLEATLTRIVADAGGDAGDPAATLALGGPVELASVTLLDGVYVRTPQRDVSCERFAYDARTGEARIASAPGRPAVSIIESGRSTAVEISGEAIWNMNRDRIRVVGASGGADR